MKKILVLSVAFFMIFIHLACSCSMMAPFLNLVVGNETCYLDDRTIQEFDSNTVIAVDYTDVNRSNIDELCPNISITDEDKDIIFDFVDELKDNHGYTNIEKQTDVEYSTFLDETSRINSEICKCQKITVHGRNESWTAYTVGFKETCSFSTACYQPPAFCFNSDDGGIKKDIIPIAILGIPIIILLLFLINRLESKK